MSGSTSGSAIGPACPSSGPGFPEIAANITGDGPELAAYAARIGTDPMCLLERLRRDYQGFMIFPLPWVSHHWQQAVAIFADLTHFPKRQVFRLGARATIWPVTTTRPNSIFWTVRAPSDPVYGGARTGPCRGVTADSVFRFSIPISPLFKEKVSHALPPHQQ